MYGRTKVKYRCCMSRFVMIIMLTIHSVNMVFE